jgi:adenylate cyclase
MQQAMRLSPHDPRMAPWHDKMASAELGLGHFDAAIEEENKAIDAGFKVWFAYLWLATARALKGDIDEAKAALAEARRLNPKLSVKMMMGSKQLYPISPQWYDALRKAGLPEE